MEAAEDGTSLSFESNVKGMVNAMKAGRESNGSGEMGPLETMQHARCVEGFADLVKR